MNKNIILGGGCFWCTEAIYKYVNGVVDVMPGYMGGSNEKPSYEEVCTRFIKVDTQGVTASNLNHFDYHHRRKPMFPFERNFEWYFSSK